MISTLFRNPLYTFCVLGRVSNLPTVWTNILAASLFSISTSPADALVYSDKMSFIVSHGLALTVGLSCLYLGGMFFNDAWDADWDQHHKVPRPIPLGYIKRNSVYFYSFLLFSIGVSLLSAFSLIYFTSLDGLLASSLLLSVIIIYDIWHKKNAWSRFLMGACRAGVYLIAALFVAQINAVTIIVAVIFGLYISGITLLAQFEKTTNGLDNNDHIYSEYFALLLLCSPLSLVVFMPLNLIFILYLTGFYTIIFYKLWPFIKELASYTHHLYLLFLGLLKTSEIKSPQKTDIKTHIQPRQIGALLGAIPLFDALVLASVEQWLASFLCIFVYFITPVLHKYVSPT